MSDPRRIGAAALALLAMTGMVAPAVLSEGSPAPAPASIPFQLIGSTVLLPVHIDQSDSLWFILDTGAEGGAVHLPRAEQLGLRFEGESEARGAGGIVNSRQLAPLDIELGSIRLRSDHDAAFPLVGLAPRMGHVVDGIVGSELFRRYVVEIDYAARLLRLYEPSSFHYGGKGQRLDLTFTDSHPYVHARLDLADGREIEGRFVVDSGSSQGVILLPEFAQRESVAATVAKTVPVSGLGVGGEVASRIGRIAGLELGELRLRNPTTTLPPPGPGQFATQGSAGNLGGAILKKFRCIFDYSRSQLILEPVTDLDEPIPFDASGLALIAAGAAFDSIMVTRVIPGSPAEEAGIRPGDGIEALDEVPVASVGILEVRERLRKQGELVRLAVSRGDRKWTVPLLLRDLL